MNYRPPDKRGIEDNSKIIFLFLNENIHCEPPLEIRLSQHDGSNEGLQYMFNGRIRKNIPNIIPVTPSYLKDWKYLHNITKIVFFFHQYSCMSCLIIPHLTSQIFHFSCALFFLKC